MPPEILQRFQNVQEEKQGQWNCRCPSHDDQKNSLAVSVKNDGTVLLKCLAGCATGDVLAAVGMKLRDLFPAASAAREKKSRGKIVAQYQYRDETKLLLYEAVRFEPKDFRQRTPRPDGSWDWRLNGVRRVLYRLPQLLAADPASLVFISEGEKDADNLAALGLTATTNVGGAGKWRDDYSDSLKGRHVCIVPDNDEPGRKHAQQVAKSLAGKAASIKILDLAGLPEKGDVSDWIAAGGTKEKLLDLAQAAPVWGEGRSQAEPQDDRPRIDAACENLEIVTAQAWDAIREANDREPAIFRHAGVPARIEHDDRNDPLVRHLNADRMRHTLARVALWVISQKSKKGEVSEVIVAPPKDIVLDVMATPDPPLPKIMRLVQAPVFAPDGTIQTEPGYHPASMTFYAPDQGFEVQKVPARPDSADIESARNIICDELLGDFPFVHDLEDSDGTKANPELANAVALLLLPFARDLIPDATPLHLFEKPSPGTGATLLVDVLTFPATGRPIPTLTEGRNEDEWRKRITAKLMKASTHLLIDNLRQRLDSAAVSAAITSPTWEDRILGSSLMCQVAVRCCWLATANNPALSSEISRRTVRIRMDAKCDRPWLRTEFKHPDLRRWAKENRGLIVWAALTMIQAWIVAGKPRGDITLGMFESWSQTIGGILQVAGIPGLLSNLTEFYDESDTEGAEWRTFVAAWWDKFQVQEVKAAELWKLLSDDVVLHLGDGNDHSRKVRLGIVLTRMRDRTFDLEIDGQPRRLTIRRGRQQQRAFLWHVQE